MNNEQKALLAMELEKWFSSNGNLFGTITRSELARRSGGLFNSKTMANWDSRGKGFKRKLVHESGRKVAYFIEDVLEYLGNKYRVVEKRK
ncbi:MAG: hypothetical protein LIP28_11140 [Deltaproteobacteria bacterium]|nr:hypothetical protein [Deltaproteobacteria bacterium]